MGRGVPSGDPPPLDGPDLFATLAWTPLPIEQSLNIGSDFEVTYGEQGLQVLGFDVQDPLPLLLQYVQQMKMNYPVLIGEGHDDVLEAFGPMAGLPTTVIIGRDGKICSSHTGLTDKATFEEAIKALL